MIIDNYPLSLLAACYYQPMKGKFIVIEGIDYSGKGTQVDLLRAHFPNIFYTREPGGTPLAEQIRAMVLLKDGPRSNPLTDFFLFQAARASHVNDVIAAKLSNGTHVICDRYDSSTYAFQVVGEQRKELDPLFWKIRDLLSPTYHPDAYLILDLSPETAVKRSEAGGSKHQTRFDVQPLDFHKRVREGLLAFADKVSTGGGSTRVHFVDANKPPEDVANELRALVAEIIGLA